jgi:rhamnose utilization protein RhaD (predicted bifunctional aldolase and dehydrogenase)
MKQFHTSAILKLSHELGREDRKLAILGEGNASVRISDRTFAVKASGANLATLSKAGVVECRFAKLSKLFGAKSFADETVETILANAKTNPKARKPSVEAIFHAYLLTLPNVNFVAHTHPVAVNKILCSGYARVFARHRLFPDEVVCCGTESVLVPYTDPGLRLAQAIRAAVAEYVTRLGRPPRVILLENHGLIAIGATPGSVLAATLMCVKAAEIFAGATAIGDRPRFLTSSQVRRIAGRADEHYRQKVLGL